MKELKIVVEDGRVSSVYSDKDDIDVEVIDLDTQDPDEEAEALKRLKDIENAEKKKRLVCIY